MSRVHKASARLLLTCSAVLLFTIILAGSAGAHAHLKSSTPSDGEVLTAEPATVSAVYEEETSLTKTTFDVSYAKDASAAPRSVAQGTVDVNNRTNVSATLPPGLGDGVYTVKWHTLTEADNGIVDGSFTFTVAGAKPASGPTGKTGTQQEVTASGGNSTMPATGVPETLTWMAALTGGFALLCTGLVMRRRTFR